MFAGEEIEVRRIALTMDQVRLYNPPANFIRDSDKHSAGYRRRFNTDECWELDALSPTVIAELIRDELDGMIDDSLWQERKAEEKRNRIMMAKVSANWAKVKTAVGA